MDNEISQANNEGAYNNKNAIFDKRDMSNK